jgi:hypothetical protein
MAVKNLLNRNMFLDNLVMLINNFVKIVDFVANQETFFKKLLGLNFVFAVQILDKQIHFIEGNDQNFKLIKRFCFQVILVIKLIEKKIVLKILVLLLIQFGVEFCVKQLVNIVPAVHCLLKIVFGVLLNLNFWVEKRELAIWQ